MLRYDYPLGSGGALETGGALSQVAPFPVQQIGTTSHYAKSIILGTCLLRFAGLGVLRQAVQAPGPDLTHPL